MKVISKGFLGIITLLLIYLMLWPVAINPQSWQAPPALPLTGDFAVNNRLSNFDSLPLGGLHGPEAVIADQAGAIYATTHEGWIIRWQDAAQTAEPERWVKVGGRPLGIAFDTQGNLWVANAYLGLQKVSPTGKVTVELTQAEGTPILYADDLDVDADGVVYFSDASMRFSPITEGGTLQASLLDLMEQSATGRIIAYNSRAGTAEVILRGLSFANGVALAEDETFLIIAETGRYRVWKHRLQGAAAGQTEIIIANLPGFPDNVHRGRDGRFWVGLTSPRSAAMDKLAEKPFWRKVAQRLPAFMRPTVIPYGHVLAIDSSGSILRSLQDPSGSFAATTGVWETDTDIFVSSLTEPVLARIAKKSLGL